MNATEKKLIEKLKELVEHVGGTDPKWCHTCKEMLDEISALEKQIMEPEDELREETKQKLAEENKDSTWKGHSQGYYYHFIEGWDACIDYLKSKINTNN